MRVEKNYYAQPLLINSDFGSLEKVQLNLLKIHSPGPS